MTIRIVETEAYLGPEDLAAHSARGRTARNDTDVGAAGAPVRVPRLRPARLRERGVRPGSPSPRPCSSVPARWWRVPRSPGDAAGNGRRISGSHRGPGTSARRWASGATSAAPTSWPGPFGCDLPLAGAVAAKPRIGVGYAGEWAALPYRFLIPNDPFVSRS